MQKLYYDPTVIFCTHWSESTIEKARILEEILTRREREKIAHRREIMEAGIKVFARKGCIPATLEEVAQEAGFSKGGIYLYFESKEDLLYSVVREKSLGYIEHVKKLLTGERPFREELTDFFLDNSELAFGETDFVNLMISMHTMGFKDFSSVKAGELLKLHRELDNAILIRIEKAISAGELRELVPEAIAGMINGALENMMVTRWEMDSVEDLKKAVEAFMDILFEGIAQQKEKRR